MARAKFAASDGEDVAVVDEPVGQRCGHEFAAGALVAVLEPWWEASMGPASILGSRLRPREQLPVFSNPEMRLKGARGCEGAPGYGAGG